LSKRTGTLLLLGLIGVAWILMSRIEYSKQQDQYDKEIADRVAAKDAQEHQSEVAKEQAASNAPTDGGWDESSAVPLNGKEQTVSNAPADSAQETGSSGSPSGNVSNPFHAPSATSPNRFYIPGNNSIAGQAPAASGEEVTPAKQKPHRDLGVDLAIPIRTRIPLMDSPESNAKQIRAVSDIDLLVLIDREPTHDWYNVIDVRTGKEGWVNGDDVRISLTKHPIPAAKFSEEYVGPDAAPEVVVANQTSGHLSLKVEGTFYTLKPNSQLPVAVSAGTFSFYATEPGAIPAQGRQEFKRGYRYTWKFWIETSYSKFP